MSRIDLAATHAALRAAAARTAALLGTVSEPSAPVPGLSWNVSETAAHVVGDIEHYTGFVTGERDAREYLALASTAQSASERAVMSNARLLEEFAERDLARLAEMMTAATETFISAAADRPPDDVILTEAGLHMTMAEMSTTLLGELLIHGLDLARAVRAPWPISRADALLVIAGIMALAPNYVDADKAAGLHLAYELRFRGGPRYRLTIDNGKGEVGPATGKADCWISADPATFLTVAYGRLGQWGPILRGKMLAGGRKPWLGLRFGQLVTSV